MPQRPTAMHVAPVIAVTDLDRARDFYEGLLGLDGAPAAGGGWRLAADRGTLINLLPGEPKAGSARWPVATFLVDDAGTAVRALRDRGVRFLGMDDVPFALDADGVSTDQDGLDVAWLRDPDGNILTIYSLS